MSQSQKRAPLSKLSLPNFIDEFPFSIQVEDNSRYPWLVFIHNSGQIDVTDNGNVELGPKQQQTPKFKTIEFTELRIKGEQMLSQSYQKDSDILYKEIIQNAGQGLNEFHKIENEDKENIKRPCVTDTKIFALGVEQQPTSDAKFTKYLNRVVLINERGDRILDTLVKPIKQLDGCKIMAKNGIKTKIFQLAVEQAPSLETVAEVIAHIVKDRPFVGYHQATKLSDMGYWSAAIAATGGKVSRETYKHDFRKSQSKVIGDGDNEDGVMRAHSNRFKAKDVIVESCSQQSLFTNLFDTAKIFNRTAQNQIQFSIGQLCLEHLNLCIPGRTYPFAFTEAKISMALYFRWLDIKNGKVALPTPIPQDPKKLAVSNRTNFQPSSKEKNHESLRQVDTSENSTKDFRQEFEVFKHDFKMATSGSKIQTTPIDLTKNDNFLNIFILKHVEICVKRQIKKSLLQGLMNSSKA